MAAGLERRSLLVNPVFEERLPVYIPSPLISRVLLWKKNVEDAEDPTPIRMVDGALCKELGYEMGELIGKSFIDLVYDLEGEREGVRDMVENYKKSQKTTFLVGKKGQRCGPYTLNFKVLRRMRLSTPDRSKQVRPCITITIMSCSNRDIIFKLQDFFVDAPPPPVPRQQRKRQRATPAPPRLDQRGPDRSGGSPRRLDLSGVSPRRLDQSRLPSIRPVAPVAVFPEPRRSLPMPEPWQPSSAYSHPNNFQLPPPPQWHAPLPLPPPPWRPRPRTIQFPVTVPPTDVSSRPFVSAPPMPAAPIRTFQGYQSSEPPTAPPQYHVLPSFYTESS